MIELSLEGKITREISIYIQLKKQFKCTNMYIIYLCKKTCLSLYRIANKTLLTCCTNRTKGSLNNL